MMHSLGLAANNGGTLISSSQLAEWLNANPTLVRKLLKTLGEHGLITSQLGRNGGVCLSRPADEIFLKEIYEASIEDKKLWTPRPNLPQICVVSTNFEEYFETISDRMEDAVLDSLAGISLAQSLSDLLGVHKARCQAGVAANLAFEKAFAS